jgi:hypothetical protein
LNTAGYLTYQQLQMLVAVPQPAGKQQSSSNNNHLREKLFRSWVCASGAPLMAKQGKTAEKILEFYYPGTEIRKLY